MDSLLNKLDNLAYDLFGVLLPGLVASSFLVVLWFALGPLVPLWSFGSIPELTWDLTLKMIRAIPWASQAIPGLAALMIWYFLGHAVNWISKGRSTRPTARERFGRIWAFLRFRTKKPASFDPALQSLLDQVSKRFSVAEQSMDWRAFYPLAKNYLANSGRNSLVSTYQNKYTLHRSIAATGAALFWASVSAMLAAKLTYYVGAVAYPHWLVLWILFGTSLVIVSAFSATFVFYWTLWGDTIITETYCALIGPSSQASK